MTVAGKHHESVGLLAIGDAIESAASLHLLAEACPSPMHRWFCEQRQKVLSLALDAIERGDIPHDQGAVLDYLSRIRWQDALDHLKGKPLVFVAGDQAGDTAMIGCRAASLMCDASASRATGDRLTYGSPSRVFRILRVLADRDQLITELTRTVEALGNVSITEDATPILGPLSAILRTASVTVGERSVGDALRSAIAQAEQDAAERASGVSRPASWGLASLDAAVPLRAGRLYVLSARPGGGKTSLGLQAAHATARALGRRSVAYLSLEMAADELALVLACRDAQVPRKQASEAWESLLEADRKALKGLVTQWTEDGSMWLRDASAGPQTVTDVATWIRGQRSRYGMLELVVVDYLGLIKGSSARQQLVDRTAEITSTLKQVALTEGVAIILLAQITREGRKPVRGSDGEAGLDPVPRVEDLYGGSAIESDADAIVFLHPQSKDSGDRRVDAIVAKNRRGPPDQRFPLWLFGQWQYFQDGDVDQERVARILAKPSPEEDVF